MEFDIFNGIHVLAIEPNVATRSDLYDKLNINSGTLNSIRNDIMPHVYF